MEVIRGKHASFMGAGELAERQKGYESVHIDIGTGDGRFVRHIAETCPQSFVIGIDACRENLQDVLRRAPANSLFVIANARDLPTELHSLATHITINFPWGSLLGGLLADDEMLLNALKAIARPNAKVEVRLNAGALAEAGWSLDEGANRVQEVLRFSGFVVGPAIPMMAQELRTFPTTWAKRLAYGRDPRAMFLRGWRNGEIRPLAVAQTAFEV